MTVQGMKAGAFEFLTKPFDVAVLLDAIGAALEWSQKALQTASEVRRLQDSYSSLTPRERQVMALVVDGLLNKQVGAELGISETTVKAHRGNVMRKMNADSLPELVTMAATLGLRVPRRHMVGWVFSTGRARPDGMDSCHSSQLGYEATPDYPQQPTSVHPRMDLARDESSHDITSNRSR